MSRDRQWKKKARRKRHAEAMRQERALWRAMEEPYGSHGSVTLVEMGGGKVLVIPPRDGSQ